jgi:O-antigen/teichoic acid export membrane protein
MVRSVLSNWVALAVTGALSFFLTPILLRGLGDFQFGMWVLVGSALDHYGLLDMGIRTTLQRFVARYRGTDERRALSETFATALAIGFGVCVVAGVLSFVLSRVLPPFFGLSGTNAIAFSRLVVLLGLSVAVTFPVQVLGAYLCGIQRFDLFNLSGILAAVVRAVSYVLALHFGYGVMGVAVVTLGVTVLTLPLNWALVRLADPTISLNRTHVTWKRSGEMFQFSVYVFLTSVGDYFRFRVDSIVIARWLTMALVTPFNIVTRLIEYFKSVMFAVMAPLMPEMSSLDGQTRHGDLQRLFLRATRATALLSLFLGSMLSLDGRELLRLWVGARFVSYFPLLLTLVVGYTVTMGQAPSVSVIYARGKHRLLGWLTLGEGVANLVLSIYWARQYGLIGVAMGTAVPMLVTKIAIQPWYALNVVGLTARDYLLCLARPVAACAMFLVPAVLGINLLPGSGIVHLIAIAACQTALFGGLSYLVVFSTHERRRLGNFTTSAVAATLRTLRLSWRSV